MRLHTLIARPHPAGNRIDLRWDGDWTPDEPGYYYGVRIVRREDRFPAFPDDGAVIVAGLIGLLDQRFAAELGRGIVSDGLRAACATLGVALPPGTDAYGEGGGWRIFAFDQRQQQYVVRPVPRGLALHAEHLPYAVDLGLRSETIYYYTIFTFASACPLGYDVDATSQNQVAAMATGPYAMAEQLYALLPALYRRYDTRTPEPSQTKLPAAHREQGQLRRFLELPGGQLDQLYSLARATLHLHDSERVDGRALALLAEWIGWRSNFRDDLRLRRNELRYAPHLQATIGTIPMIEASVRRLGGVDCRAREFVHSIFRTNQPERLTLWAGRYDEGWRQGGAPISIDEAYSGRAAAASDQSARLWLVYHVARPGRSAIWCKAQIAGGDPLVAEGWAASRPLVDRAQIDACPSAVAWKSRLVVFWETCPLDGGPWRLACCEQVDVGGEPWGEPKSLMFPADRGEGPERRSPWAAVDAAGHLWLIWRERAGQGWELRYSSRATYADAWEAPKSIPWPASAEGAPPPPPLEDDLFALAGPNGQIWAFWAGRAPLPGRPGQTRWRIGYCALAAEPAAIYTLPSAQAGADADEDDREPAAVATADGGIELLWSARRGGGWAIWRSVLPAGQTAGWSPAEALAGGPFSQRAPLAVRVGAATLALYRSSSSLANVSPTYGPLNALDRRYAGATSVDVGNGARLRLRGSFGDATAYSYDTRAATGQAGVGWYAREAVGLYPLAGTDPAAPEAGWAPIIAALGQDLPIQVRVIPIVEEQDHG